MLAITNLGAAGIGVGCFLFGIFCCYLLVSWAYRDVEKGKVYKPSTKIIVEEYERDFYHEN